MFRYVVASADADTVGISIGANALGLNGGTIRQAGSTDERGTGSGVARGREQREPQGGGRDVHGVVGERGRR